jgi:hypothetical protein
MRFGRTLPIVLKSEPKVAAEMIFLSGGMLRRSIDFRVLRRRCDGDGMRRNKVVCA